MKNQHLMHMAAMGLQDNDEAMQFLHVADDNDPPADREVIILEDGTVIGQGQPLVLFAGPCVIESREHSLYMARAIQSICMNVGMNFVFKSSFDKANRSSINSYRGPGLSAGLDILSEVKETIGCSILTDVHEPHQVDQVSQFTDILQIPAFLARQTDLVVACGETGKPINIKKPQFSSAEDMIYVVEKIEESGNSNIILTERGTFFGYNNLVFDLRNLITMRRFGYPICADITHSTQRLGGGEQSGGNREFSPYLGMASVCCGIDVVFAEVHDRPDLALSDSACQMSLPMLEDTLKKMLKIRKVLDYKED